MLRSSWVGLENWIMCSRLIWNISYYVALTFNLSSPQTEKCKNFNLGKTRETSYLSIFFLFTRLFLHLSFLKFNFIYFLLTAGSSLHCTGFLQLWLVRAAHQLRCMGFLLPWLLLLWSTGFSSCGTRAQLPMACDIFLDQESNLYPLHQQVHFQPLDHQGNTHLS